MNTIKGVGIAVLCILGFFVGIGLVRDSLLVIRMFAKDDLDFIEEAVGRFAASLTVFAVIVWGIVRLGKSMEPDRHHGMGDEGRDVIRRGQGRVNDTYVSEVSDSESAKSDWTRKLQEELSYLKTTPKVAWYEVEENNIYIGFAPLPSHWELITRGAALRGNRAIRFPCNAWAVDGSKKGCRPGEGLSYGHTVARHGRIEQSGSV